MSNTFAAEATQTATEWWNDNMPEWNDEQFEPEDPRRETIPASLVAVDPEDDGDVSAADWEAFMEMTFVDFAERDLG